MAGRLQDKVCVVTGSASGIGAESARLFAAEGAKVVGIDLDAEQAIGALTIAANVADEAEAVAIANDTIYGLSGSVWSGDGARALRVARALETGVISINSNSSVRVSTPFGGFKQSGVGRELGPDALEHYTDVKNVFYYTEES